jgi:nitrate/nitrite transporter NarK
MNLKKKTVKHLSENNMTYLQHLYFAFFHGMICLIAGLSLIIHAIFPCWFQTAGSDLVNLLANVFKKRQQLDDT